MIVIDILKATWPFIWDAFVGKKSVTKALSDTPGKVVVVLAFVLSIALNFILFQRTLSFGHRLQNCTEPPKAIYSTSKTVDLLNHLEDDESHK